MSEAPRLGAEPHDDGACTFCVWAPLATRVTLALPDIDGGEERRVVLTPTARGYHGARVADCSAGQRYAYLLDDDPLRLPDPASASQPDGVHADSEVVDHAAFAWRTDGWTGLPLREYVISELHVGTFTPEGTFDAIIPRLAQLAEVGITAIELLPVAQFPGGRNWGYDGVDLFAPQSTYGGPDGLRRLVDAAHAAGIAVVLDVVYNHLGPEGNYLGRFGPYFSERHHTPWGAAVNVDGPGSDEVRRCFVDNALAWLRDYRIDALRLDAIHGIVDTSASPFLGELADAVADLADSTGRSLHLIAESDLNDARVITTRERTAPGGGGLGAHAQWSDDFHHALRVTLTGEADGYYADYAGIDDLARALRDGFVYTGQHSTHRGRRHGNSPAGMPGERFVVYAQNHDQVGNRLLGDRLAARLDPAQLRVAAAAVLLSPFVPMLFMGEEYADPTPFPYFVSHGDPDLVAAVRAGRAAEFAAFGAAGEAPDPQGEATFRSAVLDWGLREQGAHAQHLALVRALLHLRRTSPSIRTLDLAAATVRVDADAGWIALERRADDEHTTTVLAFAGTGAPLAEALAAGGDDWVRVLDTSEPRFGGPSVQEHRVGPHGAAVFRRDAR